jgi:hypothetical protein
VFGDGLGAGIAVGRCCLGGGFLAAAYAQRERGNQLLFERGIVSMLTWSPCCRCSSAAAVRKDESAEEKQPGAGGSVPSGVIVSKPFPRRHFTQSNTHAIGPQSRIILTFPFFCREETSTVTRPQEREIDQVRVRMAEPGDMKKAMELSMETFYGLPSIDLGMSPLALFMEYRTPRGRLTPNPSAPAAVSIISPFLAQRRPIPTSFLPHYKREQPRRGANCSSRSLGIRHKRMQREGQRE